MSTLTFTPDTHEYRLAGNVVPSVTQIIRAVLPGIEAGNECMARGTAVHKACQAIDEGDFPDTTGIEGRVEAWRKFMAECCMTPVKVELPLASKRYQFAGTIDRLLTDRNGIMIVCDIKSTIEPQAVPQIGGYSLLLTENNFKPKMGLVVELHDEETYKTLWINEQAMKRAEQTFLAFLTVFNFMQANNMKGSSNGN